jgi:hypothetical protein
LSNRTGSCRDTGYRSSSTLKRRNRGFLREAMKSEVHTHGDTGCAGREERKRMEERKMEERRDERNR